MNDHAWAPFEDDIYDVTLEIGGLANAKLREAGMSPAWARTMSEVVRRAVARTVTQAVKEAADAARARSAAAGKAH